MKLPLENQRVKKIIDYYCNGNELQFSKEINISQPRINRLFSLDSRSNKYPVVSFEIIQAIINKFINIDSTWLITGKGEMLRSNTDNKAINTERDYNKLPIEEKLNILYHETLDLKKQNEKLKMLSETLLDDHMELKEINRGNILFMEILLNTFMEEFKISLKSDIKTEVDSILRKIN